MIRETTDDGIAIVHDVTSHDRALDDAQIIMRVFDDKDALAHTRELLRRCQEFEEVQGWIDSQSKAE